MLAGARPGRTSARDSTLFRAGSFAPEGAVTARLVAYDPAIAAENGTEVGL